MSRDSSQRSDTEPVHDVLAAEAFAVPTADPELRARPVELPEDPSGIAEPHDILAAEEFAMPAPEIVQGPQRVRQATSPGRPHLARVAGAGLLALWLRRRRR